MDYMKRLDELDSKLEREGLTENEKAEVALIYSMGLLALRDSIKESIALLEANFEKLENFQ